MYWVLHNMESPMKLSINLSAAVLEYLEEEERKCATRKELITLALSGIDEFFKQKDFYLTHVKECSLFIKELQASVHSLSIVIREKNGEEAVFDRCFEAFEALCPIFYEASLARKARTEVEDRLLGYFEKCGHWPPSDMTLVAEMYYRTLPGKYATH